MAESVKACPFGKLTDGQAATSYTLQLGDGVSATVTDYGASLIGFATPDRDGKFDDVILGSSNVLALEHQSDYIGAIAGRVAGRIARACFQLDGANYQLTSNSGPHHLHGGEKGLSKRIWPSEMIDGETPAVRFTIFSEDGDEGYPGELHVSLTYRLLPPARLELEFEAKSSQTSPFNPTCHAYFNLDGHAAGSVANHGLHLAASYYTPVDTDLIPTGAISKVSGTAFDFTIKKLIAHSWCDLSDGYDHNFVIDEPPGSLRKAATLCSSHSGRTLTVHTDRPCIHLYTGGALSFAEGKSGAFYSPNNGLALETQGFPDALNQAEFPVDLLVPEEVFHSQTIFEFGQERKP